VKQINSELRDMLESVISIDGGDDGLCECLDYCEADDPYSETPQATCRLKALRNRMPD